MDYSARAAQMDCIFMTHICHTFSDKTHSYWLRSVVSKENNQWRVWFSKVAGETRNYKTSSLVVKANKHFGFCYLNTSQLDVKL